MYLESLNEKALIYCKWRERSEMLRIAVVDCCKIQKQQNIKIIYTLHLTMGTVALNTSE